RVGKKQSEAEYAVLAACKTRLEAGEPLRGVTFDAAETRVLRGFQLLSRKPLLAVYNQGEESDREPATPGARALAVRLRAHLEREIVTLPAGERETYRREL